MGIDVGSKVGSSLPFWFCILGCIGANVWLVRVNERSLEAEKLVKFRL